MTMLLTAKQLTGMFPALPTPFSKDGTVNATVLTDMVERLIAAGVQGLVPVGGTGEYTAMSAAERLRVVQITVDAARGRVPVVSGVLSPGYKEAIETGRAFMDAGSDALLLVAPFYVRPTSHGLLEYFRQYARDLGAPVLLYDIPARTGVAVDPNTIAQLAEDRTIIGMKACNTDLNHFEKTVQLAGDAMAILSGDDYLYPVHHALGAQGGILASAVLLPHYWGEIVSLLANTEISAALKAHRRLTPLLDALFSEINPGPLKAAMTLTGLDMGSVRLPLTPVSEEVLASLTNALRAFTLQTTEAT